MEIGDTGIEILWDRYIKLAGNAVGFESLPKEEIEAVKRAVEEAERQPAHRKIEVQEE